ncbi:ribonuclease P protein component [Glycomyces xiaoerkulensis]|uniref:ribonuclease P protein component n=1 Tax=Glycomyces xiaoerkulensis TaxID=2038139 RepID=UPI000C26405A|nr:ribonuclease P protein component [Glycomyces xiaoerkulensis]
MLPAEARIRRSRDFSVALKRGRRAARGGVVVHWAPPSGEAQSPTKPSDAEGQSTARAGFVVSKAVGNAVVRNRVKRRLRHAAAELLRTWPPGTDVVVRATPKAAERDYSQLSRDLAGAVAAARSGRSPNGRGRRSRRPSPQTGAGRDAS